MAEKATDYRIESDLLGERQVPAEAMYGIHTVRAVENFSIARRPVCEGLIRAYGMVKLAAAEINRLLHFWEDDAKAEAICRACRELSEGLLSEWIIVDELQGGAGTSLNMNVNEVIANRALQLLGKAFGDYDTVSPLDDINRHQSTNDTYPTALKLAAIWAIRGLEEKVVALQEAFQIKEKDFAHVVKVGRTQMQDAVLTTLGREMSAYAEALGRDRWRIYKCEERLRVISLGGTAIGSGLGAPRKFIFRATDTLRELTGIGFARNENLTDGTQNVDVFVEVSGILKAAASTLMKIASDLRLLSSGPEAGLGEIRLPEVQAGSSIMPGKINPVIPEAVTQAALQVMGNDGVIAHAAGMGSLELNPFLPLIGKNLLENIGLLSRSVEMLRIKCVEGLEADEARCRVHVDGSTAVATALVEVLGYEVVSDLVKSAQTSGRTLREVVISSGKLSAEEFEALIAPEAVCRLGSPG
ncbi:aspartate ammonia-lyase [bacterium]|nr:aspartate ammonia-lyase [bacterium]